jgi:hypothetical protein
MQLTTFFSVVPTVLALVGAIPAPVSRRDVFVPPVLYPHNGTIWIINQRHSVTWYWFLLTVLKRYLCLRASGIHPMLWSISRTSLEG